MTIEKNIWADIQDGVTQGLAAAELVNDNKRAVNEVIDVVNPLVDQVDLIESNLSSLDSQVDLIESNLSSLDSQVDLIQTTFNELADPDKGAAMVARGVVAVDSIADLLALPEGQRKASLHYTATSYHGGWSLRTAGPSGGGTFRLDPGLPKTRHNGGTVFSTTVPWGGSLADYLEGVGETDPSGTGCWVRELGNNSRYLVDDFGWLPGQDLLPILEAIKKAMPAQGGEILLSQGGAKLSGTFTIDKGISITGTGSGQTDGGGPFTSIEKMSSVDGPAFLVNYPSVELKDFTLTGQVGNGGEGIVILNRAVSLSRINVNRMGGDGIRVGEDTVYRNCNLFTFHNLKLKNNLGHGLRLHQPIPDSPTVPECNAGTVSNCDIMYNGKSGISVGSAAVNTFRDVASQLNDEHGIVFDDARGMGNVIMGGDYEVNGRQGGPSSNYADIKIHVGVKGTKIIGSSSYNDPASVEIDEPETLVLGLSSWSPGYVKDEFMGMHLPNIESPNSRVLDWYEEGVFTPEVRGTSSTGVGTYTIQMGTFTRIGGVVHFNILMEWTAHTGGGNISIGGLPFPSADDFTPVTITSFGLAKPADTIPVAMVTGGPNKSIILYTISTVSIAASTTPLSMDSSARVHISGSYRVQ